MDVKGDGSTLEERRRLGLLGLLPPAVRTLQQQSHLVMANLRMKEAEIEKYTFLRSMLASNPTLFYYTLINNVKEILPIVYTPIVGEACQKYSDVIFPHHGMFLPATEKGNFQQILRNWPHKDVRVIVVTDGQRILGLGDLGANGMGIPVGKLSLYTACAGVPPQQTLPVTLDVGTNTKSILENPNYIGLKQKRLQGKEFDEIVEEFVSAVQICFPKALIQWEDFGNENAFRVLDKYRDSVCSFNDDIQGTACVVLGGLLSASILTEKPLADHKFLFLGAGEAGVGIGDLIAYYLLHEKAFSSIEEARKRIYFVDSKGLVCQSRNNLAHHKQRYAHDLPSVTSFEEAVDIIKPTTIIGVSARPSTFTKSIITKMSQYNKRPIIFSLSNPTNKSECTAAEAYTHSNGRAIFASGSPFDQVEFKGKTFVPGQGNNAYVFPGIGMGAIVSEARTIPEDIFLVAAKALAAQVSREELERGLVYPPIERIREVSYRIAEEVAGFAFRTGIAGAKEPVDVVDLVKKHVYQPGYGGGLSSKL